MMSDKGNKNSCCGGEQFVMIAEPAPCCDQGEAREHWVKGSIDTPSGRISLVETKLTYQDILGAWKARWGIKRMNYRVSPGLYGVGTPDDASPVLVTANYKMSFDRLRKELSGLNVWIMVLDTKGINVWCAAGKGTFGTAELVRRIAAVGLGRIVSHRTIILPQLGAPGVAAHEAHKESGFKIVYGPVRARDIKVFLESNMRPTREMRRVKFGFLDRLVLTPMELAGILKPVAILAAALIIAGATGFVSVTFSAVYPFIGAVLIGAVVGPACLPWIPGRSFSWKGWILGFLWAAAVLGLNETLLQDGGAWNALPLLLLLPAISAFLTLNFTGASTYTSLSGVRREMRFAMPVIVATASVGIGVWLVGRFI